MASRMQVPPNSDLTLGMTCVDKSTPGRCVWRMRADERFANPAGIMQGGFVGAFADSSMGAAAVTWVQERRVFCSNAEMKISFLAAVPPGAELTCTAEVVSGGRRVSFVEASVTARVDGQAEEQAGRPGHVHLHLQRPRLRRPPGAVFAYDRLRDQDCALMAPSSDNGSHGLRNAGDDAFQLTVDYLKQEVVEPLRGLGRFLYMGIAGSFFLAFGLLLILLGVLRLLQTETGSALTGDWSWVPYAVTVVLGIAVIAVAALRIQAGPGQAKLPEVIARRDAREIEGQEGAS